MKNVDVVVVGGGPAGLCAAISAADSGAHVLLIDRNDRLGGQLIKQTHMFFGSEKQFASTRGFDIAHRLLKKLESYGSKVEILPSATVLGIYEDGVMTLEKENTYLKIKSRATVVATGASEKTLMFPNNDLPGIYGAGAVQTLMNLYGILPGKRVLMVGAGNIGLIVSYQLMQAGVEVVAIVDAAPEIGGYLVHASKIRRAGIPIYTRHTVKEAQGKAALERVVLAQLDDNWVPIEGTEKKIDVDVMCVAVGLSPLVELLQQTGCKMAYVPELGGQTPIRNKAYETTNEGIFIAGDVAGIEEASSAMVEGYLAGLNAAKKIGYRHIDYTALRQDYMAQLEALRSGPMGENVKRGLERLQEV